MPVTKQAIKKVRADKRKTRYNLRKKKAYKQTVKDYLKNPTEGGLRKVFTALDRAAKVNIIHKNKASRMKSRLSKKLKTKARKTASSKSRKASKS
ncbi:30S ribosomal protein S20 [Candidatus Curtissbacteria bacterium]|nr:30S ribosomal protein S20 [Candidatus Curtissbacteria bacterium]